MGLRISQSGYTVVELVASLAIAAILLTGLQQLLSTSSSTMNAVSDQTELSRQARFAMTRMVDAVRSGGRLLVPQPNNPSTPFPENIRDQTVPASPPPFGSFLATAVLAVTISATQDLDGNGVPDADNDGDGRIDEDLPADTSNDGKSGLRDFDDDGNGIKDHFLSPAGDDDESSNLSQSEDALNGTDDDSDGSVDEDPGADNNGDGCPGKCGFDDDGDGSIDEGNVDDDDEDGQSDEDWYDPVVFYLSGSALIERRIVPWDESGDGLVTGRDFVESTIANNVTLVRFERLVAVSGQQQLVDITLALTNANGNSISLNTRVRLGAGR